MTYVELLNYRNISTIYMKPSRVVFFSPSLGPKITKPTSEVRGMRGPKQPVLVAPNTRFAPEICDGFKAKDQEVLEERHTQYKLKVNTPGVCGFLHARLHEGTLPWHAMALGGRCRVALGGVLDSFKQGLHMGKLTTQIS